MNSVNSAQLVGINSAFDDEAKIRSVAQRNEPKVFTDIYLEETNIAIWQRELSKTLKNSVDAFLKSNSTFQAAMTTTPQSVFSSVSKSLGDTSQFELSENIAELVDMFCCLFELKRVGLRLRALDRAMCPNFHIDKVPCRLVTTYQGVGTQWVPHETVNREKLSAGSKGKPDNQSGLYKNQHDIQHLSCGDVALLKGELWEGNEKAGLVHRSPAVPADHRRLLLTLDFSQ